MNMPSARRKCGRVGMNCGEKMAAGICGIRNAAGEGLEQKRGGRDKHWRH